MALYRQLSIIPIRPEFSSPPLQSFKTTVTIKTLNAQAARGLPSLQEQQAGGVWASDRDLNPRLTSSQLLVNSNKAAAISGTLKWLIQSGRQGEVRLSPPSNQQQYEETEAYVPFAEREIFLKAVKSHLWKHARFISSSHWISAQLTDALHSSSGGYSRRWSRGWGIPRRWDPGSPAGWACTASRTHRPCAWHTTHSCTSDQRSCRGCSPAGPLSNCTAWLWRHRGVSS